MSKSDWVVMPANNKELAHLREKCRRMVRRRAVVSAGVSAVPIPGVDVLSDATLFALLVNDVNKAFGLTEAQIARLQPQLRQLAYQSAVGVGGMMVGRFVTRELVLQVFKKMGMKMFAKSASRLVPLAGQMAAAAIGFTVFRRLGYEHVEACVRVVAELNEYQHP